MCSTTGFTTRSACLAGLALLVLLAPVLGAQDPMTKPDTITIATLGDQPGFIQEFEARRVRGGGGKFITARELRDMDDRSFTDVLRSKFSGLAFQTGATGTFAYNRSQTPPRALTTNSGKPCFVQIVMDAIMLFTMGPADASPPDMAELLTRNFDAVEYYGNSAGTPPEYRSTGASCGTLILWSRRR